MTTTLTPLVARIESVLQDGIPTNAMSNSDIQLLAARIAEALPATDPSLITITQRLTSALRAAIAHAMGIELADLSDSEARSFCCGLLAGTLQEIRVTHLRETEK